MEMISPAVFFLTQTGIVLAVVLSTAVYTNRTVAGLREDLKHIRERLAALNRRMEKLEIRMKKLEIRLEKLDTRMKRA